VGYGGATWDTAGTLTVGSDNTFAVADSTTDADGVYDQGWWTFTAPTAYARITLTAASYGFLKVYTGASFAAKVEVDYLSQDGDPAQAIFDPTPDVEYHVLMGRGQFDPPLVTYVITWAATSLTTSPWYNTLQDDPDNYLIVTDGDLRLANPNPDYAGVGAPINSRPEWMNLIVNSSQGREGEYRAVETVLGSDVHGAASCVISHAEVGDEDVQNWNTLTTGTDNGAPTCRTIPTGAAETAGAKATTGISLDYTPGAPFDAPTLTAAYHGPSYGLLFLPVRDNLPPWGALVDPVLNPEDYGYPADATLQWEDPTPDLLGVELADGDPIPTGTADITNQWVLNSAKGPVWQFGFSGNWLMGDIDTPGPVEPYLAFTYGDGNDDPEDVEWHEVPDAEGWDGHDWHEDHTPVVEATGADGVVVAWPASGGVLNEGDDFQRDARIAVKFVLQARRFRFVYEGTNVVPPRRIDGRSDGATHGARRALGGNNTVQSGNRVLGTIL
jgi:hypothetical protein